MEITLFRLIFNNIFLKKFIFDKVYVVCKLGCEQHFSWSELIKIPKVLTGHSYFHQLKHYISTSGTRNIRINEYEKKLNYHCSTEIFRNAIKCGTVEMLQYLIDHLNVDIENHIDIRSRYNHRKASEDMFYESYSTLNSILFGASQYGRLDMIRHLLERYPIYGWNFHRALVKAPLSKDIEVLMFFVEKSIGIAKDLSHTNNVFNMASIVGSIEMIQYLCVNRSCDLSTCNVFLYAIKSGHLEFIEFLFSNTEYYQQFIGKDKDYLIMSAAMNNHSEIVKLLIKNGFQSNSNLCNEFCRHGNLPMLKWIKENSSDAFTDKSINYAATNGHLEVVVWICQNTTFECSLTTWSRAAEKGHLQVLEWIANNTTIPRFSFDAFEKAVGNGHLSVIEWLHKNNNQTIPYQSEVMDISAKSGDLNLLKWMYDNIKLPFTKKAIKYLVNGNHMEALKWLYENGGIDCSGGSKLMKSAAKNGHIAILQWLNDNIQEECSYDSMVAPVLQGDLNTMIWLHQNRTEIKCSNREMVVAAREGHLDILQWLNENRSDAFCSIEAMEMAFLSAHSNVAKWLHTNRTDCNLGLIDMENLKDSLFRYDRPHIIKWVISEIPNDKLNYLYQLLLEDQYVNNTSKKILKDYLSDIVF
ncbi:hypothetical protein PPL_05791 [Heterostelium album PN500]|uniref:Ankyrin repeat protein n=1 Tax=Heterostelium pallidum (strain ATCC 26659 / Pp 5 / PN500) TaxID=670386 RepID=D3BB59_HETP5|nr:hypothetical protein PPL_05791 [Heterostelium album PN500]EFA81796.1 hypothetical protein PPL_05791 [Heterostelium album PN500]|eukprot:XP_020433913.1 hypothetical protein PPL_05791 [Heterostelium album PN500]